MPRPSRPPRRRRSAPSTRRAPTASAAGANGDIALGSDGTLRWIGAPIATLVSGDDPLRPRVVLLADEQLTGQARDKVAARAERFVNYQIDTLLKPLVDLKGADSILGIGRGIAFQLVENFGILNRRDIADDVKSLDQEGRAALRRLGVRFGAYHIFVPALLKPGPAGLVTLLWALTNDGKDKPGFGDVVHALAAGRTSVVVDPTFERSLLQARRLPHAWPPRRAHRHSGAARRPDPPGAGLEARHRRYGLTALSTAAVSR